jgi:hypothetical protein
MNSGLFFFPQDFHTPPACTQLWAPSQPWAQGAAAGVPPTFLYFTFPFLPGHLLRYPTSTLL